MYILLIYNLLPKNIQKTAKKEILSKENESLETGYSATPQCEDLHRILPDE